VLTHPDVATRADAKAHPGPIPEAAVVLGSRFNVHGAVDLCHSAQLFGDELGFESTLRLE
jgi:hypothetical protein